MNLRRRIERIEQQVDALVDSEEDDGVVVRSVDTLLKSPVDELVRAEPQLARNALIAYYAWSLAELHFAREQPEFYSDAQLQEWRTRKRHAESLVAAAQREGKACDIRPVVDGVRGVFVAALRDHYGDAPKNGVPLREVRAAGRAESPADSMGSDLRIPCPKVSLFLIPPFRL